MHAGKPAVRMPYEHTPGETVASGLSVDCDETTPLVVCVRTVLDDDASESGTLDINDAPQSRAASVEASVG